MSQAIVREEHGAIVERVITAGDLDQMRPLERVQYYRAVCESVGLNPLTRPFEYIKLNGKLTLYARKDATDQLRAKHGVSLRIAAREKIDDVYVVTAHATTPTGRTDESTGAVPLGKLQGEALANAMMKAETKAKRRVTLSICGLGFLDETEIVAVPDARSVHVDPETGEVTGENPPKMPVGDDDEPGREYQDNPEFMRRLRMVEQLIEAGNAKAARAALGSKADPGRPGSITTEISAAHREQQISLAYHKELGRFWQHLDRRLQKLEKQKVSVPVDDVVQAYIDPDDPLEDHEVAGVVSHG